MQTWTIYRLTSPSGKHYIGQTSNFKKRTDNYERYSRPGNTYGKGQAKLWGALQKYGFNSFKVIKLAEGLTFEEMLVEEPRQIALHDSVANGYNILEGGIGRQTPPPPQYEWVDGKLVIPMTMMKCIDEYSRKCRKCHYAWKQGKWNPRSEHLEAIEAHHKMRAAEFKAKTATGEFKVGRISKPFKPHIDGKPVVPLSCNTEICRMDPHRAECQRLQQHNKRHGILSTSDQLHDIKQFKAETQKLLNIIHKQKSIKKWSTPAIIENQLVVPFGCSPQLCKQSKYRKACHRMSVAYKTIGLSPTKDQLCVIEKLRAETRLLINHKLNQTNTLNVPPFVFALHSQQLEIPIAKQFSSIQTKFCNWKYWCQILYTRQYHLRKKLKLAADLR